MENDKKNKDQVQANKENILSSDMQHNDIPQPKAIPLGVMRERIKKAQTKWLNDLVKNMKS